MPGAITFDRIEVLTGPRQEWHGGRIVLHRAKSVTCIIVGRVATGCGMTRHFAAAIEHLVRISRVFDAPKRLARLGRPHVMQQWGAKPAITVFARENDEVISRQVLQIRRDAADGSLMETPRFDEELYDVVHQ